MASLKSYLPRSIFAKNKNNIQEKIKMKKVLLFLACTYCLISCNNQSPKEEKAPNVKIIISVR